MQKKVLVTGACGYIGSHVTNLLSRNHFECIAIDDLSNGTSSALINGEELYVANFADVEVLEKILSQHKIDAILHFAASVIVPESVIDPIKYYRNNFTNTLTLVETALKHGVTKIVFSSTAAVYGEPESEEPIFETAPTVPTSPYGKSKLMAEQLIRDLEPQGLKHVILRYFNVAGADPEGKLGQNSQKASHLVNVACKVATKQLDALTIFGTDYNTPDGSCIRDYIHVQDLAEAHILALEHLLNAGESATFNCGYGKGISVKELVSCAQKISGSHFDVKIGSRRPGDVAQIVANADAIRQRLKWRPKHASLEEIFVSALEWEKNAKQRQFL